MAPGPERDQLVLDHLYIVRQLTRTLRAPRCAVLSQEDYAGHGLVALVAAAARYQPESGEPFWPYARAYVRGYMLTAMHRLMPGTWDGQATPEGRPVVKSLDLLHSADDEDDPRPVRALRYDDDGYARAEWRTDDAAGQQRIAAWLEAVAATERERAVVAGLYGRGETLEAVGAGLGVSERVVRSTRDALLERVRLVARREDHNDGTDTNAANATRTNATNATNRD